MARQRAFRLEDLVSKDRLDAINNAAKRNTHDSYGDGNTLIGFSAGVPVRGDFNRGPFELEAAYLNRVKNLQEAGKALNDKERSRYGGGR